MTPELMQAEQELKEYIYAFVDSDEGIFEDDEEYDDVLNRLYDVLYESDSDEPYVLTIDVSKAIRKALGMDGADEDETDEDEADEPAEIDEELELYYRLANDDKVAKFYFELTKAVNLDNMEDIES